MATSFQKTYQVTVTFTRDDGGDIADTDLNSVAMRTDIKKIIAEVTTRGMGLYNAQPGTITES
jgi:hypothetical protein